MNFPSIIERTPSEVELVGRMAAGDESALGLLYDRFGAVAYGLAFAVTESHPAAELVVSDTFANIWREAHAFDPARMSCLRWLSTLVRSRALAEVSRSRKEPEKSKRRTMTMSAGSEAAGSRDGADRRASTSITRALGSLSDVQRQALELAYFRGLSRREIAQELQLPVSSVGPELRSAMDALRLSLSTSSTARETHAESARS